MTQSPIPQSSIPQSPASYPPPPAVAAPYTSMASAAPTVPDIALLNGEAVVAEDSFTSNLVLAHLRTRVMLTSHRIIVQRPNTLFGIIPLGYSLDSAPLSEVERVTHGTLVSSRRIMVAALLGLFALFQGFMSLVSGGSFLIGYYYGSGLVVAFLFMVCLPLGIAALLLLTARRSGLIIDTGGDPKMAAMSRGPVQPVELLGTQVIESVQINH